MLDELYNFIATMDLNPYSPSEFKIIIRNIKKYIDVVSIRHHIQDNGIKTTTIRYVNPNTKERTISTATYVWVRSKKDNLNIIQIYS